MPLLCLQMRSGGGDSLMSTDSEMDVTDNPEEIWSQKVNNLKFVLKC